jgi:hypothetical protein
LAGAGPAGRIADAKADSAVQNPVTEFFAWPTIQTAAFSPTLEVSGRVKLSGRYVGRPCGSLGVGFRSNSDWTASARLRGGLGAGSFATSPATDPVVGRPSAGVQLFATDGFDFRLTYDGAFSEHTVSNAPSLRAALRF